MMMTTERRKGWLIALNGLLAGYVASRVMRPVTNYLYEHENRDARKREDTVRGNMASYEIAAGKLSKTFNIEMSDEQKRKFGLRLHQALGLSTSVGYAFLRRQYPFVRWGQGLAFGTAFFLLVDELLNAVARFTPPPKAFPWQAHGRGLAGHLTYGIAAENSLKAIDWAENQIMRTELTGPFVWGRIKRQFMMFFQPAPAQSG